jgi:PilZ domain
MAHRLRSAIRAAEAGESLAPLSLEPCRRDPHAPPPEGEDGRARPRRRAERHRGVVVSAAILYRGKPALVRVANVSKGGVTLETSLTPELGERLSVAMEGGAPRSGAVRWVRGGRIGVDLDAQ